MMSKRAIAICFLLISCSYIFGQGKAFTFLPKWKPGDKRTASLVQHELTYKSGKQVADDSVTLSAALQVLEENDNIYTLKVLYENVALRAAINFYDRMGEELKEYKNLDLRYAVNKLTGKANLVNWKEAQQFMKKSFVQIHAVIEKKVPDMADLAKLALKPIEDMFRSKATIESYMTDQVGYLLFPLGKKFIVGDTLRTVSVCANPFNPTDSVNQTTLSYLTNIDETKKLVDINISDIMDLSEFKNMMKQMMQTMAAGTGAKDSAQNKAATEIDNLNVDVTNLTVISFDYNLTWPQKMLKTATIIAEDPKGRTEKKIVTVITIK